MTHPFSSLLSGKARPSRLLAAGLFAALAADASALSIPQRVFRHVHRSPSPSPVVPAHEPYLTALGPAPLRFALPLLPPAPRPIKPAPVADVSASPQVTAPESPDSPETAVESSNDDATQPDGSTASDATNAPTGPRPILPDDTPRQMRAEDVLPYFELPEDPADRAPPGLAVPFTPATPAGATLPPSSATYQQK